ncbi:hypothetical protein [Pedobacter sp.]|jgi:hypothetical protein|uniref:hypothetical protein n=1 Tax=Pedobacter sp. TaxID=1411316 RepID=UPI002C5D8482|nr:hypothetical protein [Pedobacter sp.]HWW39677.1 hypothetical protein [Pedobacter sp.]
MSQYKIKGLANSNAGFRIKGPAESKLPQAPMMPTHENEGIASIPGDIGNAGLNLLFAAGNKAMQLPNEFSEAGQQLSEHPLSGIGRGGAGILSGLLEGAKGLYNLPLNINTYLGSKNIPLFKQIAPYAEKLKIGNTGLEHAILGESQRGDELFHDIGAIAPLFMAPEAATARIPAITSKGIVKQLSKAKAKEMGIAKKDYTKLFSEAHNAGLTHALPSPKIVDMHSNIVKNSQPKFHTALKKYLAEPTIENAHWANSELGAFERHLDSISRKTGLTPSQIKTYKNVLETRKGIKEAMFSKNAFGSNPKLAMGYTNLANKYRENVIPYTRLEDLSEYEAGKMRPKTAVKNLLKDEEFMVQLAKNHPGIFLHNPSVKKVLTYGTIGGLLGYNELKKFLK